MDDTQRIVKCGNLALHTPGGFFKKRWHSKYLVLYDGSKSGVKRLELFESEIKFKKQSPVKIVPLVNCVRIVTCQRHKTTFTFEVRTSDQFYLLASKSFQDMNDWVNCLRFVAFGQQQQPGQNQQAAPVNPNSQLLAVAAVTQRRNLKQPPVAAKAAASSSSLCATSTSSSSSATSSSSSSPASSSSSSDSPASSASSAAASAAQPEKRNKATVDVLLQCQQKQQTLNKSVSALSNGGLATGGEPGTGAAATPIMTASQAAAAAASALARTRQRQPSLLGSCKPQPPEDSPFIQQQQQQAAQNGSTTCGGAGGQIDTLTPTVRGQLIAAAAAGGASGLLSRPLASTVSKPPSYGAGGSHPARRAAQPATASSLDEEEENMLYCSIEDNPSEHNYRVKVIETELALRCQLKCYQLTASTTVSQQYEELSQFRLSLGGGGGGGGGGGQLSAGAQSRQAQQLASPLQMVTFYQLIIGPQELTLLNDYATSGLPQRTKQAQQPQGLWSWPYQCIRRYGFDKDNCFMFEAGRKCTSGPGQFVVQTPKAYNIYQDVVKFVNELRTISGACPSSMPTTNQNNSTTTTTNRSADAAAHASQSQVQAAAAAAVTQIPVTWTPHCATATSQSEVTIPGEPNDNSRRQFFDALRQLDANQTTPSQPQDDHPTRPPLVSESTDKRLVVPTTITSEQHKAPLVAAKNSINSSLNHGWQHQAKPISAGSHDFRPPGRVTPAPADVRSAQSVDAGEQAPPLPVRSESARALAVAQLERRLSGGNAGKLTGGAAQRPAGEQVVVAGRDGDSGAEQRQQLASLSSSGSAEETDESGYEQGDESVDSRRPRTGPSGAKSSKLSSSASSSASSSSSGSPGQSVSRRTGLGSGASLEAPANSRSTRLPLPASLTKPRAVGPQPLAVRDEPGLAPAMLAKIENQEDFEASLIRDVYSEITKLHAKFAVTTNGTDEGGSMSSGGGESHATSSDDNLEAANEEDEDDYDSMGGEPMYTNLGAPVGGGQRHRASSPPNGASTRGPAQPTANQSHQLRGHQPAFNYDHSQYLYRPPHYPTMLNPIPEMAEQQATGGSQSRRAHTCPEAPSSYTRNRRPPLHNNNNNNNINTGTKSSQPGRASVESQQTRRTAAATATPPAEIIINNTSDIDKLKEAGSPRGARLALNREAIKRSQQSVGPSTQLRGARNSSSRAPLPTTDGAPGKSALPTKPTNHYLINDVQYAKISRNMAATTGATSRAGGQQRRP